MGFLLGLLIILVVVSVTSRNIDKQRISLIREACKLHKWEYNETEKRLKCSVCKVYPGEGTDQ